MKIPFYRHVRYENDGHNIFQCLHCGEHLDTIGIEFLYCPYCGIQFKGMIFKKREEYIKRPVTYKTLWRVECTLLWDKKDDENWSTYEMNSGLIVKEAVKRKREGIQEHNGDDGFLWKFRIVKYLWGVENNIAIDMRKYYKKTGKHFLPAGGK